jgi:D-alanyl-lipoteichoic acid acyltransferase DltB (MBOAT superfamily)
VASAEGLAQAVGVNAELLRLDIVLPVGISFYTFQTMSYTIDVYRGDVEPTDRFIDFALYVAFFPQLVAGPIERGKDLLPRLLAARTLTIEHTARGLHLILRGLFKKVAIADGVAHSVNQVFGSSGQVTGTDAWIATVLFAIQIYCDFSGYTDIARGTSRLLGIDLRANFNLPYFSTGPQEFWSRWHISLSTWLRDYLYIPLGGNRGGLARTYRNLMITMLLGGLWHGAAWHFVLWGLYHGVLLSIHRGWTAWRGERTRESAIRKLIAMAFFFLLTLYGWLLFRAESLEQIVSFTIKMATDWGHLGFNAAPPRLSAIVGLPLLVAMEIREYRTRDQQYDRSLPRLVRGGLYAAIVFVLLLSGSNEPTEFIYFAF